MGAKHSKGSTRTELRDVVPRTWSELELLYTRFQQEAFRRRTSDPQSQFFLSFPVFRHVVAAVLPSPVNDGTGRDTWEHKERLLRIFQYLDCKHRQRIAAIDFFAGLTLVTKGKKAAKFEFLFSLLDNGGLKTLNACEVMMILAAAARGLVMFKAIPPVDEESLRPLARRLLGERQEIARSVLVEKALTDPEIVFFMNDLENEAATNSDALLAQQGRLMKSIAANELQLGRLENKRPAAFDGGQPSNQPRQRSAASAQAARVPSAEAILRRLQALLQPAALPPLGSNGSRDDVGVKTLNPSIGKRIDPRSLCRIVHVISDGSLVLTNEEAKRMVVSLNADELSFVKSSEILRSLRPWVLRATSNSPPVWQSASQTALKWLSGAEKLWLQWTGPSAHQLMTPGQEHARSSKQQPLGTEVSYSFKAKINTDSASSNDAKQTQATGDDSGERKASSALHIRIHFHHQSPPVQALIAVDPAESETKEEPAIVFGLRLRLDVTDEEAIDVASGIEQLVSDETIKRHIDFAIERCEVTVMESQLERPADSGRVRCLRLRFVLKVDLWEIFELRTGCQLSALLRSFFASFGVEMSVEDIIRGATGVAATFPQLVKSDEREKMLRAIFESFDKDEDGLWSLQEFNSFQQAMKESAFDDSAFMQCFGARHEISFIEFAHCFGQCSADTFRALLEKLGHGSLSSQLKAECAVNMTLDEHQLMHLESSLSPLQWGQVAFKKIVFLLRSLTDLSCDFHCQSITHLLQTLGLQRESWDPLDNVTSFVNWFYYARDFLSPRHREHERDFVCRSFFCSLEEELSKSPQQLEQDDQQRNVPQGTSARQARLLSKVRTAGLNLLSCVDGIESVSLENQQAILQCEVDNFNLVYLLRKAVDQVFNRSAS